MSSSLEFSGTKGKLDLAIVVVCISDGTSTLLINLLMRDAANKQRNIRIHFSVAGEQISVPCLGVVINWEEGKDDISMRWLSSCSRDTLGWHTESQA